MKKHVHKSIYFVAFFVVCALTPLYAHTTSDNSFWHGYAWQVLVGATVLLTLFYLWNRRLQVEKRKYKKAQERLEIVIESANLGIWELDLERGVSYNDFRLWKILGYDRDSCEITIDELTTLVFEDDREYMLDYFEGRKNRVDVEFRIYKKDGSICWLTNSGQVIKRDQQGRAIHIVGIAMDITSLKNAQEEAIEARERIKRDAIQKDALLKELHHRVKNNLQVISSFLSLQANHKTNPELKQCLSESNMRIRAMSRVHEHLYIDRTHASVDVKKYLQDLIEECFYALSYDTDASWTLKGDSVELSVSQSTILGLIVNEILSNAFKYAFKSTEKPKIEFLVCYNSKDGKIFFGAKDNGSAVDVMPREDSLGLEIIKALSMQLGGDFKLDTENGYSYEIVIPKECLL